jgi:hypothetical protein
MSEIEPRIEIIKKMRGKIIEYLSKDCMGCAETAPCLREHICFSKEWFVHCSDYWNLELAII